MFFSFFIGSSLVFCEEIANPTRRVERKVRGPYRGLAHDVADVLQHLVISRIGLYIDHNLVMNMEHDRESGSLQPLYGLAETVPGDRLHAILGELIVFHCFVVWSIPV